MKTVTRGACPSDAPITILLDSSYLTHPIDMAGMKSLFEGRSWWHTAVYKWTTNEAKHFAHPLPFNVSNSVTKNDETINEDEHGTNHVEEANIRNVNELLGCDNFWSIAEYWMYTMSMEKYTTHTL